MPPRNLSRDSAKEQEMRKTMCRKCWLKLAAVAVACGSLYQSTGCNLGLSDLSQSWVTAVADQYIALYFTDRFNVPASPF
jgi:hypothetical protein